MVSYHTFANNELYQFIAFLFNFDQGGVFFLTFKAAAKLKSDDFYIHYYQATILQRLHRHKEAIAAFIEKRAPDFRSVRRQV